MLWQCAAKVILAFLIFAVLVLQVHDCRPSNSIKCNRASARADTQMTHRKESNTESGHNTKWLITANGPLQS